MITIDDHNVKVLELFQERTKDKDIMFLDIGCGRGVLHPMLYSLGYKNVFGTDIEKSYIEIAEELNPYYKYRQNDICKKLPFKPNSFDVVTAIEIFEHVECPRYAIKNMLELVKPTGFCVLSTPNALGYEFSSHFRRNKNRKINGSVMQYLTPSVLEGLIRLLGGKIDWIDWKAEWKFGHIYIVFSQAKK